MLKKHNEPTFIDMDFVPTGGFWRVHWAKQFINGQFITFQETQLDFNNRQCEIVTIKIHVTKLVNLTVISL